MLPSNQAAISKTVSHDENASMRTEHNKKPHFQPYLTYYSSRSTDDAMSKTLHLVLSKLDKKGAYVRMPSIDFSSALNTIHRIPQKLVTKVNLLFFTLSATTA